MCFKYVFYVLIRLKKPNISGFYDKKLKIILSLFSTTLIQNKIKSTASNRKKKKKID